MLDPRERDIMHIGMRRRIHFHVDWRNYLGTKPGRLWIDGRMNMMHYVLYYVFDKKHYLAEFKGGELPKRVLDIGCGTGIWIHEVSKQWAEMGHTDVEFVGVDLVPIQTPMVLLAMYEIDYSLTSTSHISISTS